MAEKNYDFRERMSVIHSDNVRDFDKKCGENQTEVTPDWCISVPDNSDVILLNASRDLEDFFFTSMKVSVKVCRESELTEETKNVIRYTTDCSLKDLSYRFTVTEHGILLCGKDSRMAAQAGYYLEDLMNLNEGPFAEKQDEVRTHIFSPRMIHSGYGLDMYPDDYLIRVAHAGIDAILVFVNGVDITPHGYHDFNDLCRRANNYGIDAYAYSYLPNIYHPDDEKAFEYYDKLYGNFFERCPYFKGIIFVGESCEFPSKDEHTTGRRRLDNIDENGELIIKGKKNPGWWPCYDYKDLFELLKSIIRKRKADADIVMWSYNWCGSPAEDRKKLIDTLPKDITVQATFEMGSGDIRDGFNLIPADYSLFKTSPSTYLLTEGEIVKQNGMKFYAMTNTAGRTWDCGVTPYLPAPYQWIDRFEHMLSANENLNLSGIMESHHFGFTPSFITELSKFAFTKPKADLYEVLKRICIRDFSEEYADKALKAYKLFSDGVYNMVSVNIDQYGPLRIGPAYPFVLFKDKDIQIPAVPYAHFGGNRITFPEYGIKKFSSKGNAVAEVFETDKEKQEFDYRLGCFKKASSLFEEGAEILNGIIPLIPERKRDNAKRIAGIGAFLGKACLTTANIREFYKRKAVLLSTTGEERNKLIDELIEICTLELENAYSTIPLVEFDSALGYEPSMEYMCDRKFLEWKIEQIKGVIERELPSLRV